MTDAATPPATDDLGTYDGLDILGTTVSIRNAGDGLSDSLAVDPAKLPVHSTVHVVLECEVTKHTYEEVRDTNGLRLVNVLKAGRATLVDGDLVRTHLDEQQARIEEAEGTLQLPLDGPGDGEPQQLGDVLNDAIDLNDQAEHDQDWRRTRTKELDKFDKPGLVALADDYGIPGRSKMVKAELVDAIADHEDQAGGDA